MYKELTWMDAKRLRAQGMSYVEIAERLGIDRRTAKKLCVSEDPPRPGRRERKSKADDYEELIRAWLSGRPRMKATWVYQRLCILGYEGSYSVVKRKVAEVREELSSQATVRFETLPGHQAQVDFGQAKARLLSGLENVVLLVVLLGFSRFRKILLCPRQDRPSLMWGLAECFREVGGTPHELLFDNLKAVVLKPRSPGEDAVVAPEWLSFCAHYGTNARICFPYRAQTKGKVERPIGVVKSFLYSHTFLDLEHLEKELALDDRAWGARVHTTTGMAPENRLLLERKFLLPLPEKPFPHYLNLWRTVSKDCFVSFEGNMYSVPHAFSGKKVCLRVTAGEVRILSPQGALLSAFPGGQGRRGEAPRPRSLGGPSRGGGGRMQPEKARGNGPFPLPGGEARPLLLVRRWPMAVETCIERAGFSLPPEGLREVILEAGRRRWSYERFLEEVISRELALRAEKREGMLMRLARFPQLKTLEDFDLTHLPDLDPKILAEPGELGFLRRKENVLIQGPPGIGKTHLALALGLKAVKEG